MNTYNIVWTSPDTLEAHTLMQVTLDPAYCGDDIELELAALIYGLQSERTHGTVSFEQVLTQTSVHVEDLFAAVQKLNIAHIQAMNKLKDYTKLMNEARAQFQQWAEESGLKLDFSQRDPA